MRKRMSLLAVLAVVAACSKDAGEHAAAAKQYADQGKLREASIEYRNAIAKDPTLADARLSLAETYLKLNDPGRALGEYVRAADLLPDRADVQLKAGSLLLVAQKFEDARARAERVLAKQPSSVEGLVLRANALAGLSDFDKAVGQLEDAIALEPKSALYANLGALEQARGHGDEAEAAFRRAVALDPSSATAHLGLANFLWSRGRVNDAEQVLKTAFTIDRANALTNRALATLYLASGRSAEAEPHLIAVVAASTSPRPKLGLATFYAMTGKRADAYRVLDEVTKVPAAAATARARIAALKQGEGKEQEALTLVDAVLAAEPRHIEAMLTRARVLLALSRGDEARAQARAAVAVDPNDAAAQYLLGSLLASNGELEPAAAAFKEVIRLNPKASPAQVQLARIELRRGAPGASVQLASEAMKNDPQSAAARLTLVRAYSAQRQYAQARAELATLMKAMPDAAPVHIELGTVNLREGQLPAARTAFERALALDARSIEALTGLTAVDVSEKKIDAARKRIAERLVSAPQDSRLLVLSARTALADRDSRDAEASLRRAIEADAANLDAYALLGQLYLSQKRLDEARTEFERLAERRPGAVAAQTMVGMILQVQGKNPDAEQRYERAVQADPRAAVAANNLSWLLAERKHDMPRALRLAQSALQQLPDRAEVNDTLGFVYLQQGLPSLAIPPLKDAVQAQPLNPVYHYRLGLAYSKAGQVDNARRALEHALKLQSTFPGADEARKVLAGLAG